MRGRAVRVRTVRVRAAAAAAVVLAGVLGPGPAHAVVPPAAPAGDPGRTATVIEGEVLRLVSRGDRAAMRSMVVGVPVPWDVTVSADAQEGTITLSLRTSGTDTGAFRRAVRACDVPWTDAGCPGTVSTLLVDAPAVGVGSTRLTEVPAAVDTHLRVDVALVRATPGARVAFDLVAHGRGDVAVAGVPGAGGAGALARTGADVAHAVALAAGAVLLGLGVARAAAQGRDRRRAAP